MISSQERKITGYFDGSTQKELPVSDNPSNILIYSPENLIAQASDAPEHLGYRCLRFYVDAPGVLSKAPSGTIENFYYSPSGGTLRDSTLNIVLYSAKFDLYKGLGRA